MDIKELRLEIDAIDETVTALLTKRMELAQKIARYKEQHQLPVLDAVREREKMEDIVAHAEPDMEDNLRTLYSVIFELSREHQMKVLGKTSVYASQIRRAIADTPQLFPEHPTTACQGVWGAYAQLACDKLFRAPKIMFIKNFEGVFTAIEKGLCQYGVLPLENSTAGSVNQIYDLMAQHQFHIVRCVRLKIDHNLLVKEGATKEDIKEIISHEQALVQCEEYLKSYPGVKITMCENTAAAAELVAQSDRKDVAALSSMACAELYGLQCLEASVQDKGNNYTRFICISKKLEIYPGANQTSLMMILPHKPGALYKVLSRFFALGINLVKLESRPLPDRDFEFMFYFDIETSVYSEAFIRLVSEFEMISEECRYMGSYLEIV